MSSVASTAAAVRRAVSPGWHDPVVHRLAPRGRTTAPAGGGRGPRWASERLVFDGDQFFAELLEDIAQARTSIFLETYIYADDAIGQRVAEALAAAVARGVHVRLLVDGAGAHGWILAHGGELAKRGVPVRVYHPTPFLMLRFLGRMRNLLNLVPLLLKLNRRDHRKICVIDGRLAWVASFNVSSCHCHSIVGDKAWRDTAARVEGTAVAELSTAFAHTWQRSWWLDRRYDLRPPPMLWHRRERPPVSGLVRLNTRVRERWRNYLGLVKRIGEAKRRVWITNAYFVPTRRLRHALRTAARNGADVRLLLPAVSDVVFMPWVAAAFYRRLLQSGVRIFEYQPAMLHAKDMLIDDWASVGSTNLNSRSLLHDLECNVVLPDRAAQRELAAAFERDRGQAKEIRHDVLGAMPWWKYLLARFGLRMRYWM